MLREGCPPRGRAGRAEEGMTLLRRGAHARVELMTPKGQWGAQDRRPRMLLWMEARIN